MLYIMKSRWIVIPVIVSLFVSSCTTGTGLLQTKDVNPSNPSRTLLKTTLGDFVIASSRLVDEVHDQKSRPGEEFLLVVLTQPDSQNLVPGEFSLDAFQKMMQDDSGNIYVTGAEGSQFISTMAGWVEDEFTMGFTVPIQKSFTLHWPGNDPIELNLQDQ